jgi:hypothetical protein
VRSSKLLLVLSITPLFIAICARVSAQNIKDHSCDVPLVITRFVPSAGTVELVQDLSTKDLAVKVGGLSSTVENASIDRGGKRIGLILDASKRIPQDEWKLETETAVSLIEHARPEDKFSLFVVGGDVPAGSFLLSSEVQERLKKLAVSRPDAPDETEKIYDALLLMAKRLDPPEFGDAIFLFGHPDDSGSKANPEQVQELLLRNRLRFYAMSFTDPLRGKLPPGFDLNKPIPSNVGMEKIDQISHATGYFVSFHSTQALNFPGQIPLLKGFLGDLYAGIAEPYRLKIDLSTSGKTSLNLVIKDGNARNIRQLDVHYPHFIYRCSTH